MGDMHETMRQPPYAALLPILPAAEVYRDRRRARRGGLWRHNHVALELDGVGRHAMAEVLNGSTPDYRCDRPKRTRGMQIEGTETLGSEEFFAIALEGELGKEAVLAWARVLLAAIGYEAVPREVTPEDVHEALAVVAEAASAVQADTVRALGDNTIDEIEAALVAKRTRRLEDASVTLRAAARFAAQKKARSEGAR